LNLLDDSMALAMIFHAVSSGEGRFRAVTCPHMTTTEQIIHDAMADRVPSMQRTTASDFLITVNRLTLSLMIRDPFVAAAFKAAEDDGLAPNLAEVDRPRTLAPPLGYESDKSLRAGQKESRA
jgi:hypothetical protein